MHLDDASDFGSIERGRINISFYTVSVWIPQPADNKKKSQKSQWKLERSVLVPAISCICCRSGINQVRAVS